MEIEQNQNSIKSDPKDFNTPLQEDLFYFHQSPLSSDEHVSRYKNIIYGAVLFVVISGMLTVGYYLFSSDVPVSTDTISGENSNGYDSVLFVPKNGGDEDIVSGKIRSYSNSAGPYKHILVSASGDGKVIQYYLVSDNIDLSLSEGYHVELHGKFIEENSVFDVKSIKLK